MSNNGGDSHTNLLCGFIPLLEEENKKNAPKRCLVEQKLSLLLMTG